ncbi:pleckstrin homology domain-containing family A member 6-like [Galendromus occidentalis]|uniref:Pleckstrin homology domain-containing family A member 6-like n=1 Tax=Galendromus occidentalis TaxID=34638 RepID=A0AAJ7SEX6_9ACAR|nr:pleckstrin homology domain-containing family A member 6-like [Galendromus occidentalis]
MNLEFRKSLRRKKTSTVPPPTVERDVNAEISLKGWLSRLEGSPLKHWKKRWCVLAQYALFVYKDEDEQKLLTSVLLPGYNVRVCTSHDRVSHKNAFVAEHSQMKSFYFAADSNAAMCQWRNSMAQAATVQIPPPEHISPPPQAVYERDYGRYLAMTCVTRSPIYANAPPKPKRLSPPNNRPRSADFLNEQDPRRPEPLRPHTSMKMFDPHWGAPAHPRRPKSCLAEPMFSDYRSSPTASSARSKRIDSAPQDIYGSLQAQPQILHPAPIRLSNGRFSSPSTSASSTPPPSFNRHANFHNSSECYTPPQANFSSLAHSLNSLSRPSGHQHIPQQLQHPQQPPSHQYPQTRFQPAPDLSRSTNNVIMSPRSSLRIASPHRKPPTGRTISFASSISGLDEIQPSKLEMFRQLPQPSYSTKSLYDSRDLSLHSSRDLQSLQSLTDSQYSTAPPESSLPSLESNSDVMMVVPSPVQHFTNVPPAQLRMQAAYSPKPEVRSSPPKYSEACLRSELAQRINSISESAASSNSPLKKQESSSQGQHRCSTPTRPENSSRKLLFDKITCSPVKTPLAEKNRPEEPYAYGREDLLKASQIFYSQNGHSQPVGTESRHLNSLDISFQSSSHNSVFEHDREAAPAPMLPIMSQMDRTNYAILKQEIEGSKVLDTNNNTNSRNGFRSASESVSSNNSQNSIIKNLSRPLSPESSPVKELSDADIEKAPRQGTVSAKLAFFEAKTSPEPARPRSTVLNSSANMSKVPDLIDELRETSAKNRVHVNNYVTTASSEDILKTITANKHQRSLSLLEGPTPDVVPTQSPPYYYSDLSLSARSNSRDSLREVAKSSASRKQEANSQEPDPKSPKSQSCENLLKKQSLKLPEITQSASCLLDCEPFYENIGFGCKSSAVKGPEPQSSPAKISFLAASSTQAQKTASVDELNTGSESSQESLPSKSAVIRQFCGLFENSSPVNNSDENVNNNNLYNNNYHHRYDGRSLGPPDLVQSTLNSSADAGEHGNEIFAQIINSIKRPSKIEIPERYVSESDSEADFTAVERLARYHKADTIRRRIAGQSRDQAHRLTVNQVIAKQAKHVSKIVAAQQ